MTASMMSAGPPDTPKIPVTDEYHGVKVTDDYRWLETWDDPRVRTWSDAQNAHARSVLDALPGRDTVRSEITRLRTLDVVRHVGIASAGGKLFARRIEPRKQQALLVVMARAERPDEARVLVDPNTLDPAGGTSIDWHVPSPDGTKVAVSLSQGGSERGDVHVFDVASGRQLGEVVTRVNYGTAGGSLAWDGEGSGFYYTRYPREGERPRQDLDFYVQVYHHRLGTQAGEDRYEIGMDFPRIAEIRLSRSRNGRFVLAHVQNGDGGEFAQFLRTADGRWAQLTTFADHIVDAAFGPSDSLFLLSRADAPRGKLLELPLTQPGTPQAPISAARVVVPEGDGVITSDFGGQSGIVVADSRLFLIEQVGGPERVRVLDLDGRPLGALPTPDVSGVAELVHVEGPSRDEVLYLATSFLNPPQWRRWVPGEPDQVVLSPAWAVDFGDIEVVREWADSRDGTRVPMTLLRRKGTKLDGRNPTLLTGYGGYSVSLAPVFDAGRRAWFDRGGVFVVANLRGGGEFGDAWHRAGNLTRKQNVFDDFLACAGRLIALRYTAPDRLAIEGGSNGGLLMGAALTQRPDLFRAVVSHVGIYDMLRVELSPNGTFNIPEFGTVANPDHFRAMQAYSPYHHVVDGRAYPSILLLTGANDARVDPMHSRKMTARLQAAGADVLLRTSGSTGHGSGTPLDARIEQDVDVYSFLFARLRMTRP
jgi:prolyl oligopeptidase